MTEDFRKTATDKGDKQLTKVLAAVQSLKATARTSDSELERANALLQLEQLGETID